MRFQAAFVCRTRGQRVPTLLCQRCFTRNVETVAVELYCRRHVGMDTRNAGCVGWALVAHAVVLRGGCMPVRFQAAFGSGTRGQRVPTLPCQRCFARNVETVAVELYCRRHVGMDASNAGCVGWALVAHAVVLRGGCACAVSGCLCQYLPRCLHAPVCGFFKHRIAAQIAVREHDARTVGAQGGKQGRI